jgi:hypothetical protein
MKCSTSDVEIEVVYNRICNGDLDLQPEFQRGEIWTVVKQQKLIDTILRGWKIPPVHVVVGDNDIDEVLDGQQRLASIRNFMQDRFAVDGEIAPVDPTIANLNKLLYSQLDLSLQRSFKKYIINFVRLSEYIAAEPAELFYRLNQPTALTSAEQRNAFIGSTRNQIKDLVKQFEEMGASKELIGFSNLRLSYDEVISKFCYTIEQGTLRRKVTGPAISDKYRLDEPFSIECISKAKSVIEKFMNALSIAEQPVNLTLNKATLFSWFIFFLRNLDLSEANSYELIVRFEFARDYAKGKNNMLVSTEEYIWFQDMQKHYQFWESLCGTFNQRAGMGSTDALAICYRDIILHIFRDIMLDPISEVLEVAEHEFKVKGNVPELLDGIYEQYQWGMNLYAKC